VEVERAKRTSEDWVFFLAFFHLVGKDKKKEKKEDK
jgi:hypothetical protein